jgi:hypothetical protein
MEMQWRFYTNKKNERFEDKEHMWQICPFIVDSLGALFMKYKACSHTSSNV